MGPKKKGDSSGGPVAKRARKGSGTGAKMEQAPGLLEFTKNLTLNINHSSENVTLTNKVMEH